ncbi:hypothetical protein ACG2K1_00615 [Neisseria sp. 23W00296]|uniref:hypothetical protein n=1 Tax=unclassified Neisseria TaxID=2623750 RepID=UPI0002A2A9B1|nr:MULTISPECIES: hypothetical protein [unclassified Neisseria]ASP17213.1 hypothetical protein CGZ77_05360 [Neisseria sp. KEM232]EKY03152.1 hypothetical protein HMPREF9120_02772 [Neisseria sp. oral taxon 020 str. F0370]
MGAAADRGRLNALSDGLNQRKQPVNKRKTKKRQTRAARPAAVPPQRAKPSEKPVEKLFALGMVTAFAALVPLFSLMAEIVRAVMENGFSSGLSATLLAAKTLRLFFAQTAALATLFVLYFIEEDAEDAGGEPLFGRSGRLLFGIAGGALAGLATAGVHGAACGAAAGLMAALLMPWLKYLLRHASF